MKSITLACCLAALTTAASAQEKGHAPTFLEETCGDLHLRYDIYGGIFLRVNGLELVRGSSIYSMKPGWTGRVYYLADSPRVFEEAQITKSPDGSKTIVLTLEPPADTPGPFNGKQIITMHPDNSIEFQLDFRLDAGTEAGLEWGVARLNPWVLMGAPYKATTTAGLVEGTVFVDAPGSEVAECTLATGLRSMTIDSRVGPITIEANEAAGLIMFDYRENRWAEKDNPYFWLGAMDRPLEAGKSYSYYAKLDFPDTITANTSPAVDSRVAAKSTSSARVPDGKLQPLIPAPKQVAFSDVRLPLNEKSKILLGPDPSAESLKAAEFFVKEMTEYYDLHPEIVIGAWPAKLPKGAILMGEQLPAGLFESDVPDSDEGYLLRVDDKVAAITGRNGAGVFHGATTLAQLVVPGSDGAELRGAEIRDWPSLSFRGIHAYSGKNAGDEIARAMRQLLARYKSNYFLWTCEQIIWDSAPEVAHPNNGMTKDDARKVIEAADENMVTIVPMINSLGHSDWMFVNNQNLELAEDPDSVHSSYNPTDPRSYEFIFKVYSEALQFFNHPRLFHIGHDEIIFRGRFPYRSRNSGKTVTDLIIEDCEKINNWFRERGVRTMIWGDMFLAPGEAPDAHNATSVEEARERRERLPKDIIITDWHYEVAPKEGFTSLKIWQDAGFDVIGCPWYIPENIHNQTMQAIDLGIMGMGQTTWAGFNFKINDNEAMWYQYWAYIMAAHYAWSGDTTPPSELSWSAREVFLRAWFGDKPLLRKKSGFLFDLAPVANRSLQDDMGSGWLGFGPQYDLAGVDLDQQVFGETRFRLAANEEGNSALLLAGKLNPDGAFPDKVTLRLSSARKLSALHFLSAATAPADNREKIGAVELLYSDGTSAKLDLIYGSNIFAMMDDRVGKTTRLAWSGNSPEGKELRLWDLTWENPEPEKKISALVLSSVKAESAPAFFAITGVR